MEYARTRYTVLLLILPALPALLFCREGGGNSSNTYNVTFTMPSSITTKIAVDTTVTATFSHTPDCTSLNGAFTLADAEGNDISGSVSCSGDTATLTPSADLTNLTVYAATITTTAQDSIGVALTADER